MPKKPVALCEGDIEGYIFLQKKLSDAEELFLSFVARSGEREEAATLSHNIQYQWMRQFVQHAWTTQQALNSSSDSVHAGLNSFGPMEHESDSIERGLFILEIFRFFL